tara:strand:- start:1012 stop:1245 length:234 start_codon:yes stop_codon:yes gene_type:complete
MFKTLQNKDEIVEATKLKNNSLKKVDEKAEKKIKESSKPINPKFIFEGTMKKVNNTKYRKPTPDVFDHKKTLLPGDY